MFASFNLKGVIKPLIQDVKAYQFGYSPIVPIILMYIKRLKEDGAHSCLNMIHKIEIVNPDTALYCLAECYYYCGYYEDSLILLKKLKKKYPLKEEIYYLMHKCYLGLNNKIYAVEILSELIKKSGRKKTWIYWSNIVKSEQDFEKFEKEFFKLYDFDHINDITLINYYAEAALNSRKYEKALEIWERFRDKNIKNLNFNENRLVDISVKAKYALNDLRHVLKKGNINFFIISGTLLGCIREGQILPHDKDIDIGVFDNNFDLNNFLQVVSKSGHFDIMPIKNSYYFKIKHINGVFIDIFIHYQDEEYYYHRTNKIEWKNKKFELKEVQFLGHGYYIPKNYNLYLTENYGDDWTVPKIHFDSNFDTPNARIIDDSAVEVFCEKVKTYQHYKLKYLKS